MLLVHWMIVRMALGNYKCNNGKDYIEYMDSLNPSISMQHAACSMYSIICSMQHVACTLLFSVSIIIAIAIIKNM